MFILGSLYLTTILLFFTEKVGLLVWTQYSVGGVLVSPQLYIGIVLLNAALYMIGLVEIKYYFQLLKEHHEKRRYQAE
jgi:hypothetical protein